MDFYRMFSTYYNTIFPFAEGKENFFKTLVERYNPKTALDLGCATGELTAFLARQGCSTIGIDLSPDLLKLANDHPGEFILADMVEYLEQKPAQKKDLIVCIGNTLPHLSTSLFNRFIKVVPEWLEEKGLLVIQTVNYHQILKNRPPGLPTIERPQAGVKFTRLYDYNPDGSIAFKGILDSPHGRSQSTVTLWPYTSSEIKEGLQMELTVEAEYGGFGGNPYDQEHSPAWVLVAKKIG